MTLTRMSPGTRRTLQVVGPILVLLGLTLMVIAIQSMGDLSPNGGIGKFGLGFIGIPLLFVGIVVCKFAFMKPVSEIIVTETEQAAAYGSRNIAKGVAEGLREGGFQNNIKVRCRSCGELDDEHAKFCSACGQAM